MRQAEIVRVADLVARDGRSDRDLMIWAVALGVAEGLDGDEIVALIDLLEARTGARLHPVRFD